MLGQRKRLPEKLPQRNNVTLLRCENVVTMYKCYVFTTLWQLFWESTDFRCPNIIQVSLQKRCELMLQQRKCIDSQKGWHNVLF